jgi:hypothetical protein
VYKLYEVRRAEDSIPHTTDTCNSLSADSEKNKPRSNAVVLRDHHVLGQWKYLLHRRCNSVMYMAIELDG